MRNSLRALLAAAFLCASIVSIPAAPAAAGEIVITPDGYTPPPIKIAIVRSQTTIDWSNRRKTPGSYPHSSKELKTLEYLRGRGYDVTQIIGDRDLLNYDHQAVRRHRYAAGLRNESKSVDVARAVRCGRRWAGRVWRNSARGA
jgi:hypothetical protein